MERLWSVVLLLGLICWSGTCVKADEEANARMTEEYTEKIRQALRTTNISSDSVFESALGSGIQYDCDLSSVPPPTSIHELSPMHVSAVGALGDSVTAAFGAKARTIIDDLIEFRGVSWSIGGEASLDTTITLPNIIRTFNPDVKGFSTGNCILGNFCQKRLNVAVSGARSKGMLSQAMDLVAKMDSEGVTDEDWKVVTLWIGGNDLCAITSNSPTPAEMAQVYRDDIAAALDYLYSEAQVKRMLVNVVKMIDVAQLHFVQGLTCNIVHQLACNSIMKTELLSIVSETARLYNVLLDDLINSGVFDGRDDFAVVIQPFFSDTQLPYNGNEPDRTYFAPDCFHFSQKGHEVGATYLWNNMFEPIGEKTNFIDWDKELTLTCPTDFPYFATAKNKRGLYASNNGSPPQGQHHQTNLVAVFVGTGVGIFVVALVVVGVAYGVIRRRRVAGRSAERVNLITYKS